MPYKKQPSGKYKVTSGKMEGKTISKKQMQAIEINKHKKKKTKKK